MKKYSGQFRSATWDPILIISQIIALQAAFYFSLGGILFFMDALFGSSRSLDHLFKYQEINVRDLGGKLVIAGFVINAFLGSLGLWFIVERTKQCLDFSSTTHLIHLIACWNYNSSFPNTISWWLLNIICLTIMCVSGEFLCLRSTTHVCTGSCLFILLMEREHLLCESYVTPEKFYLGTLGTKDGLIAIDRVTQELRFSVSRSEIPHSACHKPIFGVLGTIKLIAGNYLIVVTGTKKIGCINGQSIWMITNTEVISYTKTYLHLNERQMSSNRTYLNMVKTVLKTPYLYFSYTYDLTYNLQRLQHTSPDFIKLPMYLRADSRFLWNSHLLKEFYHYKEFSRYCLTVMHGFISINNCTVNGNSFIWSILSRRSVNRAGTRFFTRGIDVQGSVANYVETEQIVEYGSFKSSFVQTRGSIPLFWQQLPTLKYKPKPKLIITDLHADAFQRHIDNQILHYGKQVLVNLIDHKGSEDLLEKAYKHHAESLANPNVRYEAFDFHHECRKMRYDRLTILIDRLAHEQDEFGYFLVSGEGTIFEQDGVFRTNCIDCLDRTNVVQSLLARRSLTAVLQKLNILRPGQTVEDQPGLEALFKNVWADNADALSVQYSGTPALKTDFTRTGKRTRMGMIRDGINSFTRYYKNNFADGFRQDSLDLFIGNYIVQDGEGTSIVCPLTKEKGWKYFTFPLVLLVALSMFCANVITPPEYTTETLLYLLFWGSMVAGTVATIFNYGKEFVDYPKLLEK